MSTVRSVIETLHWFAALNATEAVLMKGIFHNFINTSPEDDGSRVG